MLARLRDRRPAARAHPRSLPSRCFCSLSAGRVPAAVQMLRTRPSWSHRPGQGQQRGARTLSQGCRQGSRGAGGGRTRGVCTHRARLGEQASDPLGNPPHRAQPSKGPAVGLQGGGRLREGLTTVWGWTAGVRGWTCKTREKADGNLTSDATPPVLQMGKLRLSHCHHWALEWRLSPQPCLLGSGHLPAPSHRVLGGSPNPSQGVDAAWRRAGRQPSSWQGAWLGPESSAARQRVGAQAWPPALCCPLTSPAFRERLSVASVAYLGRGR